ncbi:MAG: hypothetical protein R2811_15605 [Flavobacteriales bacterium]
MRQVLSERGLSWTIAALFILNALWILWIPCFPTMDGMMHLQTAHMLFEGAPAGVYCENPAPVPNVLGHYIIGLLDMVFPALLAERTMLALILLITGLGAWALARSLGKVSPLILLVLPITVNLMLALGFHNFLLGVGTACLGAAAWFRVKQLGWPGLAGLLVITLLLYLTHTMALAMILILLGAYEGGILLGWKERAGPFGHARWRNAGAVVLCCIPAVLLALRFSAGQETILSVVDHGKNLRDLIELRSLVLYHAIAEEKFTYSLKLLIMACGVLGAFGHWRAHGLRLVITDIPLVVAVGLVGIYFFIPDSIGFASFVSVRSQWIALLLFAVWVSLQPVPTIASLPVLVMIVLAHQARNGHYRSQMEPIAERCDLMLEISRTLDEGSVVLPVNSDDNWLLTHISSLLVAERDIVLLDNYECATGYFPYIWCPDLPKELVAHLGGKTNCMDWLPGYISEQRVPRIDHIVLFGYEEQVDHCRRGTLHTVLDRYYRKAASNRYATVYDLQRQG